MQATVSVNTTTAISNSGGTLLTLLGPGGAEIGGAPLAKNSQFTATADPLQFSSPGSISVTLTAANTLTVTTLVSLLTGAGMTGTGKYIGSVRSTGLYHVRRRAWHVQHRDRRQRDPVRCRAAGPAHWLGGHVIRLLDASDAVLDATSTAADGIYCVFMPSSVTAGAARRVLHIPDETLLATGAATGNSSGTYSRSKETIALAFAAVPGYAGLNFGLVGLPTLTGNGAQAGTRSAVLWFRDRFEATSSGHVSLSMSHSTSTALNSLAEILYLDSNANGQVDAGEQPVSASCRSPTRLLPSPTHSRRRTRSRS